MHQPAIKRIGEYRDYQLYQATDGHIEGWKAKRRRVKRTVRPDGTPDEEHAGPDIDRIVTTADNVPEAMAQIDRKLARPKRPPKTKDINQQHINFDA